MKFSKNFEKNQGVKIALYLTFVADMLYFSPYFHGGYMDLPGAETPQSAADFEQSAPASDFECLMGPAWKQFLAERVPSEPKSDAEAA